MVCLVVVGWEGYWRGLFSPQGGGIRLSASVASAESLGARDLGAAGAGVGGESFGGVGRACQINSPSSPAPMSTLRGRGVAGGVSIWA